MSWGVQGSNPSRIWNHISPTLKSTTEAKKRLVPQERLASAGMTPVPPMYAIDTQMNSGRVAKSTPPSSIPRHDWKRTPVVTVSARRPSVTEARRPHDVAEDRLAAGQHHPRRAVDRHPVEDALVETPRGRHLDGAVGVVRGAVGPEPEHQPPPVVLRVLDGIGKAGVGAGVGGLDALGQEEVAAVELGSHVRIEVESERVPRRSVRRVDRRVHGARSPRRRPDTTPSGSVAGVARNAGRLRPLRGRS